MDIPIYFLAIGFINVHNNSVAATFRRLLDAPQHIELERKLIDDLDIKPGVINTAEITEVYLILAEICLLCSRQELLRGILNCYDFGGGVYVTVCGRGMSAIYPGNAKKVKSEEMSDERLV